MVNLDFFFFFLNLIIVLKELEGISDRFLNHLPLLSLVKLQLLGFSEGKDHGNQDTEKPEPWCPIGLGLNHISAIYELYNLEEVI